jgi:hypothetical protein
LGYGSRKPSVSDGFLIVGYKSLQLILDYIYIEASTIWSITLCNRFISERPLFFSFTKQVVTTMVFKSGITQINCPPYPLATKH